MVDTKDKDSEDSLDVQIQKVDEDLGKVSVQLNELATHQQRLFGYRQCLVDMKEKDAPAKTTGSS